MEQVLQQINTLPGVVGSFVALADGRVAAAVFPPLFDQPIIEEAAGSLAAIRERLQLGESLDLLDLRYANGRILVKPLAGGLLLLLCAKEVNLQVLAISLNVGMKKLEKLLLAGEAVAASPPELPEAASGNLTLTAGHLIPAEADKGFDQLGMVAMNQATAQRVSSTFGSGSFKKVRLINEANGKTGTFPVMVVNDDENRYDGMAILCRAIEKKLDARAGEQLRVEV
jgi:predicted regulator of Ras-like GTPase activity (Roadblock/LC7/MglB family)